MNMSFDKAVNEIKEIFRKNIEKSILGELSLTTKWIKTEEQLDKDLSDFLAKFENGLVESNRKAIEEQAIENHVPDFPTNEGYD